MNFFNNEILLCCYLLIIGINYSSQKTDYDLLLEWGKNNSVEISEKIYVEYINENNKTYYAKDKILKGIRDVLTKIYTNSTFPKTTVIRKKAKKLSYFSIYVENKENRNMSFDAVTVVYSVGSYYKGD